MAKPAARKTSPPPARKKAAKKVTAAPRKKNGGCSACGLKNGFHSEACPNGRCAECGLMAGNHELSCASHPNHEPVLDGSTGEVIHADVDGKKAKVRFTKAAPEVDEEKKPKGITRLAPPVITDPELIVALQKGIDEKAIFGIKQPLTTSTTCEYEWYDDASQQSVGCSAAAVFDFEEPHTCPTCQATTKTKRDKLCIAHMSLRIVDALEDRQTSLEFEE